MLDPQSGSRHPVVLSFVWVLFSAGGDHVDGLVLVAHVREGHWDGPEEKHGERSGLGVELVVVDQVVSEDSKLLDIGVGSQQMSTEMTSHSFV